MTDFVQTMKDWYRMCRVFSVKDLECEGCPLLEFSFDGHGCDAIFSEFADHADWSRLQEIVESWADEHPAPVYPTWGEWLLEQGVIRAGTESRNGFIYQTVSPVIFERIPADIAGRLGLEPKE